VSSHRPHRADEAEASRVDVHQKRRFVHQETDDVERRQDADGGSAAKRELEVEQAGPDLDVRAFNPI